MRVLLDTQAFIYAIDATLHAQLPEKARRALLDPENTREISAVSISEIALKAARRRLAITEQQVRQGLKALQTSILPVKAEHVFALFQLPTHHADPIDRMIIATALAENIPVISGDDVFKRYKGLKVIW
jgi:PIN domain nuclease of toxin-antitoxin system